MLIGPMRMLGVALGMAQRATASGARLLEILDREPGIVGGPDAAARRAAGGSSCATSRSATATGPTRCTTSISSSRRASTVALVGATGSGKTTLVQLLPRLYDPRSGSVADRRRRRAHGRHRRRCGSAIAIVDDDPFLFSRHGRRATSPTRGRTPPRTRSSWPRSAPRPPASSPSCRTATTRVSVSAGLTLERRPAPADRDRARLPRRPAHPRARRRDLLGRRDHRARDQGRAARGRCTGARRS